jgi:hypothetical protein
MWYKVGESGEKEYVKKGERGLPLPQRSPDILSKTNILP